jgi:hypothetical protein
MNSNDNRQEHSSRQEQDSRPEETPDADNRPGFSQVLKSTLAAALGVQSNKNRERDFKHGSIKVFAIAGTLFTVIFIAVIILVVKLVLRSAGM